MDGNSNGCTKEPVLDQREPTDSPIKEQITDTIRYIIPPTHMLHLSRPLLNSCFGLESDPRPSQLSSKTPSDPDSPAQIARLKPSAR